MILPKANGGGTSSGDCYNATQSNKPRFRRGLLLLTPRLNISFFVHRLEVKASMVKNISTWIALSYLVFMYIMTHLPKQKVPKQLAVAGDKSLHFLAFLALGLFAALAIQMHLRHRGFYAYILPMVVFGFSYAWFDEVTQPLVGRWFDLQDILADGMGLVAGMLIFEICRPLFPKSILGWV